VSNAQKCSNDGGFHATASSIDGPVRARVAADLAHAADSARCSRATAKVRSLLGGQVLMQAGGVAAGSLAARPNTDTAFKLLALAGIKTETASSAAVGGVVFNLQLQHVRIDQPIEIPIAPATPLPAPE
jgi:hypothetical protein